ncbi:MAG: ABC transporter permease [Lentisphaerae bacterium]|nr:ABC transporter permease [Lentisphaerota bacterium]
MNSGKKTFNPWQAAWQRFHSDKLAVLALAMLAILLLLALLAPLLANPRPLLEYIPGRGLSLPFLRTFFAPESTEYCIEQIFNYALLSATAAMLINLAVRKKIIRKITGAAVLILLILPFILTKPRLERVDYRNTPLPDGGFRIMALIPYGPFEQVSSPLTPPNRQHPLGCDELGRDLASRIIYGSRISLAVGVLATTLAMIIGIIIGVSAGFRGGWFDITVMRIVEILMCFPVFLLLLIIMAYFQDIKFEQSILAVIGVIGLTGWIGVAQLARGEVLKQRQMTYVKAAQASGVSSTRIIFSHILPNILGVVMITFSFGAAGAILSESSLSFLGFGVQPPTASWGGMLRSAFGDPLSAWHMTVFPGLMLFWAVAGFNLAGEGLRKAFDPKTIKQ